jgi:hypothetical protein
MEKNILWEESLKEALKASKRENKPILIDFFNPN